MQTANALILGVEPWQYEGGGQWTSFSSKWTDKLRAGMLPGNCGLKVSDVTWKANNRPGTQDVAYWMAVINVPSDIRAKLGLPKQLIFRVYRNS